MAKTREEHERELSEKFEPMRLVGTLILQHNEKLFISGPHGSAYIGIGPRGGMLTYPVLGRDE